ncbi:hypothetical protein Bca52824_074126 [Brassica carinata]|uniref:Uncharacterized protein n=1 Tax=Brassica carinata TaxID=52824 RepID=A0A8X7U5W8_BRACI|nr:hypothetical protein Bca52824_074126 [Brassica carinata]
MLLMAVNKINPRLRNPSTFLPLSQISHWLVVSGDCFHECPLLLARNVKEGGELMGIDMVMVHEKVSSIELPHLDLIRQSLRRKRRKTWQEVLILLNIEGCVTVWRDYHGDVFAAQAERFFSKLIEKEVFVFRFPRWSSEKVVVIYSQMGSLTSTHNCNTGSLLRRTHNYLAFRSLNIIYALLDEMTDFGYPQYMEARILNEFIKTDVYRMEVTQRPPMAVTSSLLKEIRDTIQ